MQQAEMIGAGPLPLPVLGGRQVGGVAGEDIGEHRHALVKVTLRRPPRRGLLTVVC
jgi:hypothetical protein